MSEEIWRIRTKVAEAHEREMVSAIEQTMSTILAVIQGAPVSDLTKCYVLLRQAVDWSETTREYRDNV